VCVQQWRPLHIHAQAYVYACMCVCAREREGSVCVFASLYISGLGFRSLSILEMHDAALSELPLSFGNLVKLEQLNLKQRNCVLKDLPRSFENLTRYCFCVYLGNSV
jgi:hypothetical protein